MSSANSEPIEVEAIRIAREAKEKSELGKPNKFLRYQKTFLFIFAILAAGVIELIIMLLTGDNF